MELYEYHGYAWGLEPQTLLLPLLYIVTFDRANVLGVVAQT